MNDKIFDAIENLHNVLKSEAGDNAVSCHVFFNHAEYEWNIKTRTAKGLKTDGISMRNLNGEWIR